MTLSRDQRGSGRGEVNGEGMGQRNKEALGVLSPGLPLFLQTRGHTCVSEACSGSPMNPRLMAAGEEGVGRGTQTNQPHLAKAEGSSIAQASHSCVRLVPEWIGQRGLSLLCSVSRSGSGPVDLGG